MPAFTCATRTASFFGGSGTLNNPGLIEVVADSDTLPVGQMLRHVVEFARLVDTGKCKATLAAIKSYLNEEAFAGRMNAKIPPARAFARWVKIVRTLPIITAANTATVTSVTILHLLAPTQPTTCLVGHLRDASVPETAVNDNLVAW